MRGFSRYLDEEGTTFTNFPGNVGFNVEIEEILIHVSILGTLTVADDSYFDLR